MSNSLFHKLLKRNGVTLKDSAPMWTYERRVESKNYSGSGMYAKQPMPLDVGYHYESLGMQIGSLTLGSTINLGKIFKDGKVYIGKDYIMPQFCQQDRVTGNFSPINVGTQFIDTKIGVKKYNSEPPTIFFDDISPYIHPISSISRALVETPITKLFPDYKDWPDSILTGFYIYLNGTKATDANNIALYAGMEFKIGIGPGGNQPMLTISDIHCDCGFVIVQNEKEVSRLILDYVGNSNNDTLLPTQRIPELTVNIDEDQGLMYPIEFAIYSNNTYLFDEQSVTFEDIDISMNDLVFVPWTSQANPERNTDFVKELNSLLFPSPFPNIVITSLSWMMGHIVGEVKNANVGDIKK
jgi:hypothetical protein